MDTEHAQRSQLWIHRKETIAIEFKELFFTPQSEARHTVVYHLPAHWLTNVKKARDTRRVTNEIFIYLGASL